MFMVDIISIINGIINQLSYDWRKNHLACVISKGSSTWETFRLEMDNAIRMDFWELSVSIQKYFREIPLDLTFAI